MRKTTADLASRYPRTIAAFDAMSAHDHLERIARLDEAWDAIRSGAQHYDRSTYSQSATPRGHPNLQSAIDYDLVYAGGGLGLLHAVVMARYGYRVLLFDRGEVGCAYREWNISRAELRALVEV